MCGRYSLTTPVDALVELFMVEQRPNLQRRYNIAPTDDVPIVRLDREGGRELQLVRWGLVPFWAKDVKIGARMINARAETVATQGAFKEAFQRRRCLVVADGFFEWLKQPDGSRQPYHYTMAGGGPFAFAGLYERWQGADKEIVRSCTIITTDANQLVAKVHERMPVILDPADHATWLATSSQTLLRPFPAERMRARAVSARVNNVRNDDEQCLLPIEAEPGKTQSRLL